MVREGLRMIFDQDNDYMVVGEANNGHEGLKVLSENEVDVVLTDINMPVMDGVQFTKELRSTYPDLPVIALTMLGESQHIKKMLAAGASGYLLKNCGTAELKKAIEKTLKGASYYSPEVSMIVMESLSGLKSKKVAMEVPITDREKQVLHLVVKEYTNQEIADELFISTRTVDAHKRNLLDKTGSKNVAGLVLYAIEKRLFEDV
jgi:DNA-binding NarL/FixJ family response regulator